MFFFSCDHRTGPLQFCLLKSPSTDRYLGLGDSTTVCLLSLLFQYIEINVHSMTLFNCVLFSSKLNTRSSLLHDWAILKHLIVRDITFDLTRTSFPWSVLSLAILEVSKTQYVNISLLLFKLY